MGLDWGVAVGSLGAALLAAALVLSTLSVMSGITAARQHSEALTRVSRRAFVATAVTTILALGTLAAAFLLHDFRIAYVAAHSDLGTPWPLLVAGTYSGQEGSLLYWCAVLGGLGAVSLLAAPIIPRTAWTTVVLGSVTGFFLVVLVFVAGPFATLPVALPDGLGLNPVLRDGGMLIHPPLLLAGFASFGVPFAFAAGALLAGDTDGGWVAQTRRLALLSWALQGAGLVLGMWWAYHVLGWGGYWGWDPVENVALLPWLAATAYIHSAQLQERRGLLGGWNLGLVFLAFLLAVFGTFVVRSGVIQSVHTFAVSPVGPWFLAFLLMVVAASGLLLVLRGPQLATARPIEAAVSREGAFLLQNLLFVGALFAVLWGTILPLLSRWRGGDQLVVGPSYYERTAGPVLLAIVVLLAVGPLLPWRRSSGTWMTSLWVPGMAAAGTVALIMSAGLANPVAMVTVPVGVAAVATAAAELWKTRGAAARRSQPWLSAWPQLVARHRRRYGAHVAHLGVALLAVGIAGSHAWQVERTATLGPGESIAVPGHRLTLEAVGAQPAGDHRELWATLTGDGETLRPTRSIFGGLGGQAATGVAIRSSFFDDLYVVLADATPGQSATLLVFRNPLVPWIWLGAGLVMLGTLLGAWPRRQVAALISPEKATRREARLGVLAE